LLDPPPRRPHRQRLPDDGIGLGGVDRLPDVARVRVRPVQRLDDETERREHAVLERRVAVDLAQDPDAVAEPGVVRPKARAWVERGPAARLPPLRLIVPVIREVPAVSLLIGGGYV